VAPAAAAATATIQIDTRRELGRIDRKIYGHFLEANFFGNIHGGVFDPDSPLSIQEPGVTQGLRRDVIEACRALGLPVVRWPGGNYASAYHWEAGIGPREQRPRRLELTWGGQDGQARGILRRLDPEGGHEAGRTHLLQTSAEALHLFDHHLEGAARLRWRLLARGNRQAGAEEREVPPLPAQGSKRHRRHSGRGRDRDRSTLAGARLLRAFRPQLVTLEAIAQRVARDSQKLGGARVVALRFLERLDEPPALQS